METSKVASSFSFFLFFFFSFLGIFVCSQTLTNGGQWKLLKSSIGISAMHVVQLPNDMVVIFDRTTSGPSNISLSSSGCSSDDCSAHSVEFDPATRRVRPLTLLSDTWCSSGALSPAGALVQTGGFNSGDHAVRHYVSCSGCDWSEDPAGLAVRRWYASDHILPDGRVVVVGGRGQFNYEFVPQAASAGRQVFQLPFLRETKDAAENNLYPFVHLSSDGNLFVFANTKGILLDYVNHKVVKNFPEMPGRFSRNYPSSGSSVLLPLRLGGNVEAEVMICGGARPEAYSLALNGTFPPAASTCGRLTITDESPEWKMEEMPVGRVMGDMVLLPTADVLIINGAAKGTAGWTLGREPVLTPVIYHTGIITSKPKHQFQLLRPSNTPRLYHSTAHLLSDGRVLVGGSNPNARYEFTGVQFPTDLSLEAFYPPYLGNTSRPVIAGIKPEVGYGQTMSIKFRSKRGEAEKVATTMVAPAFTSHSFSMSQRVLVLEVERVMPAEGGDGYFAAEVTTPETAVVAPPGYYIVFVVHGGVPSRGKWIRIA